LAIEALISELKESYSILIVTHNMQQAMRSSDFTAFMYQGDLVEFGLTADMFSNAKNELTREYVSGKFG
jgi:phosphate transport system ATP-binding protein